MALVAALLLPAVTAALAVTPSGAGMKGRAQSSLDLEIPAQGVREGSEVAIPRRHASSGSASTPPIDVAWKKFDEVTDGETKKGCKPRSRMSFPSALGGIAIGVLGTLPVAAAIVDHFFPLPIAKCPGAREAVRANTWTPSQLDVGTEGELESLNYFWPRCVSLSITLLLQSISSLILGHFNSLIASHPSIILFLTTIVGLGGNAGCQSTVLTVRRLALGQSASVAEQAAVGVLLSLIVGPLLLVRTLVQGAAFQTSLTIVFSSVAITIAATTLGSAIPKVLWKLGVDPAHGASFIQVAMDILGILIVCLFGVLVLR